MREILLKNAAQVVTMTPLSVENQLGVLKDQDVLIDGSGRIRAIGRGLEAGLAEVVDVRGRYLMPGFVNAHEHLWQTMIVGVGCDQDLMTWLPMMRGVATQMNHKASRAATAVGASRMLNMGVTSVLDWSHSPTPGFLRGNVEALKDSGLRWALAYAGPTPENLPAAADWPARQEAYQVAGSPSADMHAAVVHKSRAANALQVPFNVHFLENQDQRHEMHAATLAEHTSPTTRLILNHAVHMQQEDFDTLAPRPLSVVHCPASNMRLASGIIDLDLMRKNQVTVGLGLDGGTNDCGDMFDTMRSAIGLQRASQRGAGVYPQPADALRMATLDGAKVLGLENKIGSLEVGKLADIVVLNPNVLHTAYLAPTIDAIVYGMSTANVEHVLVNGRFKKRDFSLVGIDLPAQGQSLAKAAQELKASTKALPAPTGAPLK